METGDLIPADVPFWVCRVSFSSFHLVSTHGSAEDIISIWIVYTWALRTKIFTMPMVQASGTDEKRGTLPSGAVAAATFQYPF